MAGVRAHVDLAVLEPGEGALAALELRKREKSENVRMRL